MKNATFTFALIIALASGSVNAQTGNSLDARVAATTREMSSQLNLNESEYIRLRSLNRERFLKASEITRMYSNDVAMRDKKMNEMQNAYETELQSFLNAKQLEAYSIYKETNANFTAFGTEETK
jgi:hypothetical protein